MPYRLPLRVEATTSCIKLIDADGIVIASGAVTPWHGVPLQRQPEFVLENFNLLAAAANRQCGAA
jgi:hypothetical protein